MAKNANGEGSIYKRMRDGKLLRYEGAISYIGDDGKTKRHTVYGRTRQDVRAKLGAARERLESGAPVRDATRTIGDWLAQWRVTTLAASDRKESTRSLYAALCRKHLEPAPFGAIPLDRLRPNDVEALVLAMRAKTKPDKRSADDEPEPVRALSDSTIRQVYTILRAGLDGAVRDGLLARNPAALVKRPGIEHTEARHLDDADVTALLRAAEASRYHPALALIAATGLCKGEALALRWDRVDLDAGALKVAATISRIGGRLVITEPKTARSRRTVPMPSAIASMLRKHRTEQKAERLRAGNQWTDSGLVFTKAVADLLGHSSIAITGDVYGHTSDDTARSAVDGRAERLGL